ncbi:hypothetical protein [Roseiconus nitratireducens]|uniref:hypothetical protein n=1 Tax=Roseiconus nitratireducens TaxID=2605748 RepID=UPI001231AD08|nr:hypothetical protein [Roseiconus nitratireducens]
MATYLRGSVYRILGSEVDRRVTILAIKAVAESWFLYLTLRAVTVMMGESLRGLRSVPTLAGCGAAGPV